MKVHFEQGCCKVVLEVGWCRVTAVLLGGVYAVLQRDLCSVGGGKVGPFLGQG